MDKPIIVSFRWSTEEFLRAQRVNLRYSKMGRAHRRAVLGLGILCLITGIVFLARGDPYIAPGVPLTILGCVFLASPFYTRLAFLKIYAQQPDRDQLVTYEISADRIASRSQVASSEALWRTIVRAYRTPEGFLLYPTDRQMHWLPANGFQDSADIERLAQIARSNVKEYNEAG